MATTAAPDGVIVDLGAVGLVVPGSPSQERLGRIAAMLREADMAAHPSVRRRGGSRQRPVRRR